MGEGWLRAGTRVLERGGKGDFVIGRLGDQAAELLSLSRGDGAEALCGLAELAVAEVPGCAGACAVVWRSPDDVTVAATHPDLAELTDMQVRGVAGPLLDAVRTRRRVRCADLADEERWPDFADAALTRGVRCCVHMVRQLPSTSGIGSTGGARGKDEPGALVLGLYGVRPGVLNETPIAATLAAFGRAMLANATAYGEAQLIATQFQDAVAARSVVDQAKGILMHALSCDADDALRHLRREAQRRNIKVTEVASEVVRTRGRPA